MLTPSDIDKLKGMRDFLAIHHFDKEALQPLDDAIELIDNLFNRISTIQNRL